MNHAMKIEITRDGRWWMVHIPEIDGLTQARRLGEVEDMAREYIALRLGVALDAVRVETASIRMQEPDLFVELLDGARRVVELKNTARKAEEDANRALRDYCHSLVTYGIPVRDIAELLDISPQRVSQLANDDGGATAGLDAQPAEEEEVSDILETFEQGAKARRAQAPAAGNKKRASPRRVRA